MLDAKLSKNSLCTFCAHRRKIKALQSVLEGFLCLNFGDPPRGRTENLLIKSKLLSVHRRAQQSTAGTILRLKAKTVPTGQK